MVRNKCGVMSSVHREAHFEQVSTTGCISGRLFRRQPTVTVNARSFFAPSLVLVTNSQVGARRRRQRRRRRNKHSPTRHYTLLTKRVRFLFVAKVDHGNGRVAGNNNSSACQVCCDGRHAYGWLSDAKGGDGDKLVFEACLRPSLI